MPTLIGILLDVSGSMKRSVGAPVYPEGGSWARSIFQVVDELVKCDVSSEHRVFALSYGECPYVFDLLRTVERASKQCDVPVEGTKSDMLKRILNILETNGAPYVREWASIDKLENAISEEEARLFLTMFEKQLDDFTFRFVQICLQVECRQRYSSVSATIIAKIKEYATYLPLFGQLLHDYIEDKSQALIRVSIREAVEKGVNLICKTFMSSVCSDSIVYVHRASKILHGCGDEKSLTEDQVDKLMKVTEPFIYGHTPMISSLEEAKKLMSTSQYQHHDKVLYVLSDGQPTDGDTQPDLSDLNVHVVSCYNPDSDISDPKRLYSTKKKFMFDLSSPLKTQHLPRTMFVKRGWHIDDDNNTTKLILQVNHPNVIKKVCAFARDVVCCQDALSDDLASINLDIYINEANNGFRPKEQEGGTCYANAAAAVLHLALKRIKKRCGGYPGFFDLREKLIKRYGVDGASTLQVLQDVCPGYRLRCKEVDTEGALEAITAKRPVIAQFYLTDPEWDQFSNFYQKNPSGTLSKKDLDITKRSARTSTSGHAVVLTRSISRGLTTSLTLMNSWGRHWANNGFFSVENADVLGLKFVDVYLTRKDLYPSEIRAYKKEGLRITQNLIASLKGVQLAKYKCQLCILEPSVREFTGRLGQAKRPNCYIEFNTNREEANDLVLTCP